MLRRLPLLSLFLPARALRLVTFNVHAWRDANHDDNFVRLIELLKSLEPDVLCLNEALHPFVGPPTDDPYWQIVRERRGHSYVPSERSTPEDDANYLCRLAAALDLPFSTFCGAAGADAEPVAFRKSFFGQYPFGNAILSRHELSDVRHELLRVGPADLTVGTQSRTEDDLEYRGVITARVSLPNGGSLGVCVTHLDHKAEELRERQIGEVVNHCRAAFGDDESLVPHIICGDLNTFDACDMSDAMWRGISELYASKGWPPPHAASLVRAVLREAGYVDAFALRAEGEAHELPPRTCWTQTRLDYVMVRGEVAVRSHATVESDASDHLPVVCELVVK